MIESEKDIVLQAKFSCNGPKDILPQASTIIARKFNDSSRDIVCDFLSKKDKTSCLASKVLERCIYVPTHKEQESSLISCETQHGILLYDKKIHQVISSPLLPSDHKPVSLSPTEGKCLETLITNHGKVLSKEEIHSSVHTSDYVPEDLTSVKMLIYNVRKKTGIAKRDGEKVSLIKTMFKRGYILS